MVKVRHTHVRRGGNHIIEGAAPRAPVMKRRMPGFNAVSFWYTALRKAVVLPPVGDSVSAISWISAVPPVAEMMTSPVVDCDPISPAVKLKE